MWRYGESIAISMAVRVGMCVLDWHYMVGIRRVKASPYRRKKTPQKIGLEWATSFERGGSAVCKCSQVTPCITLCKSLLYKVGIRIRTQYFIIHSQ